MGEPELTMGGPEVTDRRAGSDGSAGGVVATTGVVVHTVTMSSNHGSTPAAWTAVVLALAAFTVGGIGLMLGPSWATFWVGVGLLPLALLVGKVMAAAGLGSESP